MNKRTHHSQREQSGLKHLSSSSIILNCAAKTLATDAFTQAQFQTKIVVLVSWSFTVTVTAIRDSVQQTATAQPGTHAEQLLGTCLSASVLMQVAKSPFSPPTRFFFSQLLLHAPSTSTLNFSLHTFFFLKWTPLREADSLHYRHSVDYFPHSPFSLNPLPSSIYQCYRHQHVLFLLTPVQSCFSTAHSLLSKLIRQY